MIAGILTLLGAVAGIVLFLLKQKAKKKTPGEKYEDDQKEFNEHLANGDALGMSADFERLRREIKAGDSRDSSGSGDKKPPERKL